MNIESQVTGNVDVEEYIEIVRSNFIDLDLEKVETATSSEAYGVYSNLLGEIVSSNADKILPIASLAKLATILTFLEYDIDLNKTMQYIDNPEIQGAYKDYGIPLSGSISYLDAVKLILLESNNNMAVSLAKNVAGSELEFINKMNSYVEELGMNNTLFSNVYGRDQDNHHSTIADLYLLVSKFRLNEDLMSIVSSESDNINISGSIYSIQSTHKLINRSDVLGVKTGTERSAGECLITLIDSKLGNMVIITLDSDNRYDQTLEYINSIEKL